MKKDKEVKSSVYKAVKDKKTGKCVLAKKKRAKPKPKKSSTPAQPPPEEMPQPLIDPNIQQAAQQREAVIQERAREQNASKQTHSGDARINALIRNLLHTGDLNPAKELTQPRPVTNVDHKSREVFEQKTELVKKGTKRKPVRNKESFKDVLTNKKAKTDGDDNTLAEMRGELMKIVTESNRALKAKDKEKYDDAQVRLEEQRKRILRFKQERNMTGKGVEDEQDEQDGGANGKIEGGLFSTEIENMMKKYKSFQGAIASDQIKDLPANKMVCAIVNTDKSTEGGQHWRALYIDSVYDKQVCLFDSFGKAWTPQEMAQVKDLVDRINPKHRLKLKINRQVSQDKSSDACGFHCIRFLQDMIGGDSFKSATNYCIPHGEEEAKDVANRFGYV